MPRDPSDLARISPEALALVNALDALYALLEAVEENMGNGRYGDIGPAARHARACWDELTRRDSPQEIAALKQIKRFKDSNGTPATLDNFSLGPKVKK
jgi:hypothetical protein